MVGNVWRRKKNLSELTLRDLHSPHGPLRDCGNICKGFEIKAAGERFFLKPICVLVTSVPYKGLELGSRHLSKNVWSHHRITTGCLCNQQPFCLQLFAFTFVMFIIYSLLLARGVLTFRSRVWLEQSLSLQIFILSECECDIITGYINLIWDKSLLG